MNRRNFFASLIAFCASCLGLRLGQRVAMLKKSGMRPETAIIKAEITKPTESELEAAILACSKPIRMIEMKRLNSVRYRTVVIDGVSTHFIDGDGISHRFIQYFLRR